jgi:predicted phage terminase large subunit-like protein
MSDQDIPFIDESVARMPQDIREDLAEKGRNNLYFFAKGIMGFKDMTERCHGPMCGFADSHPARFKMMLMPRDHFKSSVITIAGGLQRVVKDAESRQLIANESATNSERFLSAIRQHAEGNRIFRALYSEHIPKDTHRVKWNDKELVFVRKGHYPEPTIDSIGMTGASTSRHYTHITVDDPISEEAVKSEKVMQDTITRMSGFTALLVKPNTDSIWVVGTRWALWDCYEWMLQKFGKELGKHFRSVIEDGELLFPELISHEMLALKREILGEYRFSCLYMNNPRNVEVQDLNVDDLKFYRWTEDGDAVELFDKKGSITGKVRIDQMDIITTVDLAPSETASSDRNAICTVGITPYNDAIVLDMFAKRCTPLEVIEHLFWVKQRFAPRVFGIEDVAYQKSFKYFLRQEANRRNEYFNIKPLKALNKKNEKVIRIRGLQPVTATGHLYINPVMSVLRQEMAEFPLGQHDDTIDSLSMQLQLWPHRLSPEHWARLAHEERKIISTIRSGGSDRMSLLRAELDLDPDEEIDPDDVTIYSSSRVLAPPRRSRPTAPAFPHT